MDHPGFQLHPDAEKALDAFPFYILLLDASHHILFANQATSHALGLSPDQYLGGYCPKVVHGLDGPFPGCPLEEAVAGQCSVERELEDHNSGHWFCSSIFLTSLRTEEGSAVYLHFVKDISEEKKAQQAVERYSQEKEVLNALLHIANLDLSLEDQLAMILEHLFKVPWLSLEKKGAIFMVEGDPAVLRMKAQHALAMPLLTSCQEVPFGWCLCGKAAETQQVQFASSLDERHATHYDGIMPHGHYCVPILSGGSVLGVVNLYVRNGHLRLEREEQFLVAVSDLLAGLITRKQAEEARRKTLQQLRAALEETVQALGSFSEGRDPYLTGHQRRVTELACAIAVKMGLPQDRIDGLRVAGLLHDLGKIAVPGEILSKPGRLSALEMELIRVHPEVGHRIIQRIPFPWPVAQSIYQHHERMDGSGYPQSLRGDVILLEARILAVADVVEAMASHRPYRPALGLEAALAEIRRGDGSQYDHEVVEACLKLFLEDHFSWTA
ncbi:MAG: HD domain-containing protein [Coprothermobacterota bacterium]|nr:HD domain-containing protein [Coprothermobacterota bacterium]